MSISRLRVAGQLLAHACHLVSPMAVAAGSAFLEREAELRRARLIAALRDHRAQRRRPTRPRMRALSVRAGGRFSWQSVPQPTAPGPEGALVHPVAVATCDLDREIALGRSPFPMPFHFGHECVAEVLEVGERVATVNVGDRVVVPFQISCGRCAKCRAGLTSNCLSVPPLSMYGFGLGGGHWGGTFSDVLAVPYADAMLVSLPVGVEPVTAASAADNIADAYRQVAPHLPAILRRDPEATVAILSADTQRIVLGPSLPLYAGLIARSLGAGRVVLADARLHVREHAERLGLTAITPGELKRLERAPLVLAACGSAAGLRAAINATADDGICTSVGGLHATGHIPTGIMFARNVRLEIGRSNARSGIPQALELIATGKLAAAAVTTQTGTIDDAPAHLSDHVHGQEIKTILVEP